MNFAVLDNFFLEWIFFFGCSSQGVPSSTGCVQVMLAPVENSIGFSGVLVPKSFVSGLRSGSKWCGIGTNA